MPDPQPLLSSDAEDLFVEFVDEIQRSETRPSAPPSDRDLDLYQKISNIVGHLFSIVALLRYRADYASKGVSLGPNVSFLASFVETCVLASCPDAIVLDGVWFALAKHPCATSNPLSRFLPRYAKATLIALSPFRAHPPEDAMELDEEMREATPFQGSSQNASNSTQSESDEDDAPQYPCRFTVSEFLANDLEETRAQSLVSEASSDAESVSEEPLGSDYSRHMMMNDWRGPDCLAALVMAKPGLVEDAISSALYQRRVWGVQSPVLGLAFDPQRTAIQVIIGWLGKDSALNSDLPPVNLLHCSATHLAHGVFDLKKCSDALFLAFLIVSSCEQFASDKSFALASSGANLGSIEDHFDLWREDQVVLPEEGYTSRNVEAWLGLSPICSVCSLPPDVDCDMPPKTQRNKPGRQAVSEGDQPTDKSPPEVDISDEKSDKKSQFANSAGGDNLPKTGKNMDVLLLPRTTILAANRAAWAVRIPHLKDYKAATGLALPLAWKGLDTYPVVTPDQGSLLEHLSTAVERRRADMSRPTLPLSGQLERVLSDKLSDILRFSSQAALTRSSQHANQANEAEHRQAFDGIIGLMLSDKDDLAPIVSLAERTIHTAREDLFDWTHGHKNVSGGDDGPKTFSETQVEQLVNEAEDILTKHNSQLSRDIFVAKDETYAKSVQDLFKNNLKIWHDGYDDATSRWQESPRSGKCDVIAVVQIPNFFGVDEVTRAQKIGPVILSLDAPTGTSITELEAETSALERALGRMVRSPKPFDIMGALNFDSYEASQGIVQTQESSVADRRAPAAPARVKLLRESQPRSQSKGSF
ncbi:hypothetical protein OF83DRAFT_1179089 [Amylostereum chailletii]|nr:hypothetical protein OF83DRAFT_1179089 [Amylostereum chailletii]